MDDDQARTGQAMLGEPRTETFILRLASGGRRRGVRGHVQHVRSRRGLRFSSVQRLADFISRVVHADAARAE